MSYIMLEIILKKSAMLKKKKLLIIPAYYSNVLFFQITESNWNLIMSQNHS